jgi:hypothetical protein
MLDEWREDPSRKIDLLVEILKWHLAKDGRPPLMVVDDKLMPSRRKPFRKPAEAEKFSASSPPHSTRSDT